MEEISYSGKSTNFDEDRYSDCKYALQPRVKQLQLDVKQLQCDVKQLHILYNLPAFLSDVPWCPRGGIQHNQATMLTRENCKGSDLAGFEYFSGWPLHFARDIFHLYAAAQLGVGGSD